MYMYCKQQLTLICPHILLFIHLMLYKYVFIHFYWILFR